MTSPGAPMWRHSPAWPALGRGEVHVWRAVLVQPNPVVQALWRTLDQGERDRAERFRFQRDRERFIVAHGLLRTILGGYLGGAAGQLRFCYGAYGKPELAPECGAALSFNLSHAHELALYAITRERAVGVDIEHMRPGIADIAIAERFFSPHEVAALQALPNAERGLAFFTCWTRKEAYIKARGEGLSLALDQFEVSLTPGAPAALLDVAGDQRERDRWELQALDPGPGYVAALAVEGHGWALHCWQITDPQPLWSALR
ncbi:MAG: 4'-phosphopantetheinyl transferase family protein [Roseiflexaceae bacterium]